MRRNDGRSVKDEMDGEVGDGFIQLFGGVLGWSGCHVAVTGGVARGHVAGAVG